MKPFWESVSRSKKLQRVSDEKCLESFAAPPALSDLIPLPRGEEASDFRCPLSSLSQGNRFEIAGTGVLFFS